MDCLSGVYLSFVPNAHTGSSDLFFMSYLPLYPLRWYLTKEP